MPCKRPVKPANQRPICSPVEWLAQGTVDPHQHLLPTEIWLPACSFISIIGAIRGQTAAACSCRRGLAHTARNVGSNCIKTNKQPWFVCFFGIKAWTTTRSRLVNVQLFNLAALVQLENTGNSWSLWRRQRVPWIRPRRVGSAHHRLRLLEM